MTTGRDLARSLRAAYLALHRRTDACFRADGVTADQFALLSALSDADAAAQQDLVRRVGSDPNTVSAMLLLLERRGLVVRERCPDDGRARRVSLTTKGRRTFSRLWSKSQAVRRRLLISIRPEDVDALNIQLQCVAEALSVDSPYPKTKKRGAVSCRD